ncbi:MAG TPA: GSCFA domain-containing protein [Candidatus Sulfotelmatobacter sp.]|nr:GSCFA domain-containing protein [Candidatus Sulfotelmatobacter sp.]
MDRIEAQATLDGAVRLLNEGRYVDAEQACETVLAARPNEFAAEHLKARIKARSGKSADSWTLYERLIAQHPTVPELPLELGQLLLAAGGTHQAWARGRDLARRALALRPDWLPALTLLGATCANIGPLDEAIASLRRAGELDPGNAGIQYRLSELLGLVDDLSAAERHLQQAVALNPAIDKSATQDLRDLKQLGGVRKALKRGRYPDTPQIVDDLEGTIINFVAKDLSSAQPFVTAKSRFFTMGSCFARNLAISLTRQGYDARYMNIAEHVNTTFSNRAYVDWLDGKLDGDVRERIEALMGDEARRELLIECIRDTDVFIYTLGVAPCFFERGTGRFVLPRPSMINTRTLAEKFEFRTTTVAENVDNIRYIIDFMRRLNPRMTIVITLSPVPLQITFEYESAVVADCLSKSTLRIAAHEIMQLGLPKLHYWPSFEIVRWLGGHTGPVYGVDDGASWHVSESMIDLIIKCFLAVFGAPRAPAAGRLEADAGAARR